MKREKYKKIDAITKWITCAVALPIVYGGIFFADRFWVAILIVAASILPYVVGYNFVVRNWLARRIED